MSPVKRKSVTIISGVKFFLLKLRGKYAHTLMEQYNQNNERFTRNEFQSPRQFYDHHVPSLIKQR